MSIASALDRIAQALADLGHPVLGRLQPPLAPEQRAVIWARLPFAPTAELDAAYAWRDGTNTHEGDVLDDLNFFPGFHFLSLEEAVRTYRERAGSAQWHAHWFPLFADGAGDFYVVPCRMERVDQSGVIGFIHGEPEQPVEYESLASMLETLAQAYASKAIVMDIDGILEFDDLQYSLIARRLNPRQDVWQD